MSFRSSLVRELRKKNGWSQQTLADKAGVNRTTIARIERDQIVPTCFTLYQLSKWLGKSMEQFIREEG